MNFQQMQQMMKQAQQMQERLQKQMAEMRVEASAGGGMVSVVINGAKQVQSIRIDPRQRTNERRLPVIDMPRRADHYRSWHG